MGMTVSVFFPDDAAEIVRVHGSHCTHITRDWRQYGAPVNMYVQSVDGVIRNLKREGIRFKGVRVLPCAAIPEGFWSHTPDGGLLKLHATSIAAKALTRKIAKVESDRNKFNKITDIAPYLIERYGFKVQKSA